MSPSLTIQRDERVAVSGYHDDAGFFDHGACCPAGLSPPDRKCSHELPKGTTIKDKPPDVCSDSRSLSLRNVAIGSDSAHEVELAEGDDNDDSNVPSNEVLLLTAFFSFMCFALMQLVFAFVAGSQAMIGDSVAMIVDALTYLFNWFAEGRKRRFEEEHEKVVCPSSTDGEPASEPSPPDSARESGAFDVSNEAQRAQRERQRTKRKMVLRLEVIPPIISVMALAALTVVVANGAVRELLLDLHRNKNQQSQPNVNMMLAFSLANMFLDSMNLFCFARAKHLMGYSVIKEADCDECGHTNRKAGVMEPSQSAPAESLHRSNGQHELGKNKKPHSAKHFPFGSSSCEKGTVQPLQLTSGECLVDEHENEADDAICTTPNRCNLDDVNGAREVNNRNENAHSVAGHHSHGHGNLNMCSAFTHVFADTLRSIAVIIAAVTSMIFPKVTPAVADSTAALVVSFLIIMSLIPLMRGLLRSIAALRAMYAEERSEAKACQQNQPS
jgi:Co/Zn/Cd efflux system component